MLTYTTFSPVEAMSVVYIFSSLFLHTCCKLLCLMDQLIWKMSR